MSDRPDTTESTQDHGSIVWDFRVLGEERPVCKGNGSHPPPGGTRCEYPEDSMTGRAGCIRCGEHPPNGQTDQLNTTPWAVQAEFRWAFEDADGIPIGECYGKMGRAERLAEFVVQSVNAAARIPDLFEVIAHGSDEHRVWLRKAIDDHFTGRPVEAPRG